MTQRTELFHNEWVSLWKIGHYIFSHETRCGGMIISVLPYRYNPAEKRIEYLVRSEITPCWNEKTPVFSTITGGVENESDTVEDVIREVEEEAGYKISAEEVITLGTSFSTKSSDTVYYLYTVDLTGKEQGEASGDGSVLESLATVKWVSKEFLLTHCLRDPFIALDYLRVQSVIY